MKTFLAEHNGKWFDGWSIVVAKDRIAARKILKPILKEEMKRLDMSERISIKLK